MNTLLIQSSFFAVSKFLVSTGGRSFERKTEIINLENESLTCKDLGDYPLHMYLGVGSNIGSFAVICGGLNGDGSHSSLNQCHKLVAGEWQQFATMTSRRDSAAGMVVGNSLMIFGGHESHHHNVTGSGILQSTEIINENGQVSQGPNMPLPVYYHTIATVNASTLIISGGQTLTPHSGMVFYSPLTWYFNHVTQKFQEGPSLMEGRIWHVSGTVVDHETNENIVVVAGGYNGNPIDSTELLKNEEWQQGKTMTIIKCFCFLFLHRWCAFFL